MKRIKQRLSFSEKKANDYEWGKKMIDSIIEYSGQDWSYNGQRYHPDSRLEMMMRSYKLYNNEINQEELDKDFNILGVDIGQRKDEIMPYNKAHNKINTLIGEMIKRPFNYKAVLTNSEGANAIKEVRKQMLLQYVEAQVQKNLALTQLKEDPNITPEIYQQAAQQIEQEFAGIPDPEGIEDYLANEYLEPREIKANSLLDVLIKQEDILEKKKDSFKHGLLSDEEMAWVGVENNKVRINTLNPIGMIYHKSPDVKYVQFGDYAGYRTKMTYADTLDNFKELKEKDIKKLEEKYVSTDSVKMDGSYNFEHLELNYFNSFPGHDVGQYGFSKTNDEVEVCHVEWRSERKIGFFYYIDDNGEMQMEIVDENFPFDKTNPKHISIDWDWVPEIWEGVRLDKDIYVNIRPIPYQNIDPENPYYQPLRYCGVVYNNTNAKQISTMERMRPFQMLFLIVMHKLKKLIARDRGMVIPIDTSRLPKDMELDEMMFYLDELDVFLYNSLENANQPGAAQRSGIDNAISRSSTSQIMQYIQILSYLDEQIGEVAGVTRPREGQTSPYDAVSNVQQSIIQSSNITEILFDAHTKHWEKVLNRAVDLMIMKANEEGLEQYNINDRLQRSSVSVNPGDFANCKLGVYVVDSSRDNQVFTELKSLSQLILQNDKGRLSDVIKMIKQKSSIEGLTRDIEKFEKFVQDSQTQQAQQAQQIEQQRIAADKETKLAEMNHEKELKAMDIEGKIRVAEIGALGFAEDKDFDNDGTPDVIEAAKLDVDKQKIALEREKEINKVNLEYDKMRNDREMKREDNETKIKVAKSKPRPKTK